ncbi:4-(cytidine 5'-diphospho)-2-C-methyl-D-erythritol kinase [Sphingomonas cavernae]|uniref:4-diphosphocytidyl-2-C-methyl-D-erythritol kinase n=1 Tax=Sphingomonas cavernae TaxID=2320861 RepID=A0A418W654_9SPHN|nr:4-(cytidine 5'-diphospho)-2-C-methyl-D-erythritol kinase [Sphingomonas cavernae]RJF85515.1 4-(cytidine 5'-diphospho)-2-C-methyl-D-erythritol kinase [Sphingomonas cavernae]
MLIETAWAKVNLALHVRMRRADGYHDIESLFAFAEDGDVLSAEPADALSLAIQGPFAEALEPFPARRNRLAGQERLSIQHLEHFPTEKPVSTFSGSALADEAADNLVLRAARALATTFSIDAGARLVLDKRVPVAAGLGGGSADAAAALRLLARLWRIDANDPRVGAIAAELGADVPACFASRTLRGESRGDVLLAADGVALSGMPLLLANPRIPLPTGPVFKGWDGVDRGPLGQGDPLKAALEGRNDLQPPAIALVPEIGPLVTMLGSLPGAVLARMSGSGASCFALFDTPAARAAAAGALRARWPDYWCLETALK